MSVSLDIPADAVLGDQIARLDPASVLEVCREQLRGVDESRRLAWRGARVVEALYHPGRYIRVAYALLPQGPVPARRLWPEADVVYLHAPARTPMSRRGTILTINGAETEAYRFPNDRRLRGLRKFSGAADSTRVWQRWLDESEAACDIDSTTLQRLLVRYVPEYKWVVRLRAETTERNSGARRRRRIAVRCASPQSCLTLWHRHLTLAQAACDVDAAFSVPRVVGAGVGQGILAVEWNRGQSLLEMLNAECSSDVLQTMAAVLGSFHAACVPGLDRVSPTNIASCARATGEELVLACPDIKARIESVIRELGERLRRLSTSDSVTLHDDLHCNQVRIKRGKFTLLDLERMALGDPLIDAANLATQLRMLGRRPDYAVDAVTAARWANEFIEAWKRQARGPVDSDAFRCYVVRSLLRLAHGMMRHLRAGWRPLVQRCVESAENTLASTGQQVAVG